MSDSVIVAARRTALGSFSGSLSALPAPRLGARAIEGALAPVNGQKLTVDEVIMGNVLSAGQGQAPARQAAIHAGLGDSTPALTINKMCGSGLKAVMLANNLIRSGEARCVIAGGMESMSQAPYLVPKAREGVRMGHGSLLDSMILDGLWDAYNDKHMGSCAELCAKEYKMTREELDEFAVGSYRKAQQAIADGKFAAEVVPVEIPQRKGDPVVVETDEEPARVSFDKLGQLRPAFEKEGVVTAGNASTINDGAAALLVMNAATAKEHGLKARARIVGQTTHAQAPEWFTTAPVAAMRGLLDRLGWKAGEVDLWEINEAFAVVTLAAIKDLDLDPARVNVHGGAVALGHPIGASGARVLVTLLHALEDRGLHRGVASLCIGGGEAVAVAIERD